MRQNLALENKEAVKEASGTAVVPHEANKDAIREALAKDKKSDPSPTTDTPLDPETLKKMFLTGKLTQGQLAHELKRYNDVTADSIIKEGKHASTSVVDYKDVARANIANPGSDLRPEEDRFEKKPQNKQEAKEQARDTDDPEKKQELEKVEQQQKQIEAQKAVIITVTDLQNQRAQLHAHLTRDQHIKKEEQELLDSHQDKELLPHEKSRTNRSKLARRIKTSLASRLKKLMDKLMGGAKASGK